MDRSMTSVRFTYKARARARFMFRATASFRARAKVMARASIRDMVGLELR
jgi:hypothetical protein